jgi:hypothetical protein
MWHLLLSPGIFFAPLDRSFCSRRRGRTYGLTSLRISSQVVLMSSCNPTVSQSNAGLVCPPEPAHALQFYHNIKKALSIQCKILVLNLVQFATRFRSLTLVPLRRPAKFSCCTDVILTFSFHKVRLSQMLPHVGRGGQHN